MITLLPLVGFIRNAEERVVRSTQEVTAGGRFDGKQGFPEEGIYQKPTHPPTLLYIRVQLARVPSSPRDFGAIPIT